MVSNDKKWHLQSQARCAFLQLMQALGTWALYSLTLATGCGWSGTGTGAAAVPTEDELAAMGEGCVGTGVMGAESGSESASIMYEWAMCAWGCCACG